MAKSDLTEQLVDAESAIKELENENKKTTSQNEILGSNLKENEKLLAIKVEMTKKLEKDLLELKSQIIREQKNAEDARIKLAEANLRAEAFVALREENKGLKKKLELSLGEIAEFDKKAAVAEARLETYKLKKAR